MRSDCSRTARAARRRSLALLITVGLVVGACGGGDAATEDSAAAAELEARIEELEEQLDAATRDVGDEAESTEDAAPAATTDATTDVPAPAPTPAPAAPELTEEQPEPEPEPEAELEPQPEAEAEVEVEAEAEAEDAPAVEPITIEMESQRRTNSNAFVVVVRVRSDLGGSDWGIRSVVMERPNEYNSLLDYDATWKGPQTGQGDQWTANLYCDRQGKYKDWLYVTATDDEGRELRVRFDVTAAC